MLLEAYTSLAEKQNQLTSIVNLSKFDLTNIHRAQLEYLLYNCWAKNSSKTEILNPN